MEQASGRALKPEAQARERGVLRTEAFRMHRFPGETAGLAPRTAGEPSGPRCARSSDPMHRLLDKHVDDRL